MKTVRPSSFLPAALVVLGLALPIAVAEANVIFVGTHFDIEASSPVDVGITPLRAITLTAVGKNGALPNTFDSTFSGVGGTGITTSSNRLHQVWEFYGGLQTPTLTLAGDPTPVPQELDTHFLIRSNEYLLVDALAEDITLGSPELDTRDGFGSYLRGSFSLKGDLEQRWDFAYLVVKAGTEVFLDFEIGGVDAVIPGKGYANSVGGSFVVPEPSTLLLLILGVLGLLRRSGRR
ncbi:MAG TPA: PEP-CTERM sorting domain-containing protein [Thermoguttaceae bacterium]|nr:PEP-CTERM sorting domain-containing protein [Thermoguttaceae bacterium]